MTDPHEQEEKAGVLIEYACRFLPVNRHALVDAVGNGAVEMSDDLARGMSLDDALFKAIDFNALTRNAIESAWDRGEGRV